MQKQEILDKLIQYIRTNSPTVKNMKDIPLDSTLFEKGILDSFAIVEMVAFIENNWSIRITDAEITGEFLKGLEAIAQIIQAKIAGRVSA